MKRFICWYAYQGQETEGNTFLEKPEIFTAIDKAEAMWKYRNLLDPEFGDRFYNGNLDEFRKKNNFIGWGFWCEELAN